MIFKRSLSSRKNVDLRGAILGNGAYVYLAKKHNALLESKTIVKGFILVYFQCDFWILHLKNYLGSTLYEQVTSRI